MPTSGFWYWWGWWIFHPSRTTGGKTRYLITDQFPTKSPEHDFLTSIVFYTLSITSVFHLMEKLATVKYKRLSQSLLTSLWNVMSFSFPDAIYLLTKLWWSIREDRQSNSTCRRNPSSEVSKSGWLPMPIQDMSSSLMFMRESVETQFKKDWQRT